MNSRINDLDAKRAHDKEEILKQVADTGLELKRMLKEFKVKFVNHNMYRKALVKNCCSRSKYFSPFLNFSDRLNLILIGIGGQRGKTK